MLAEWNEFTFETQTNMGQPRRSVPKKRRCRLDRTTTKAQREDGAQLRLNRMHLVGRTRTTMDLAPDILCHIVEAVMASGDAQAVRAFAVTCRATATAVATALDSARQRLKEAAKALTLAEAHRYSMKCVVHGQGKGEYRWALTEAEKRVGDCVTACKETMTSVGIRHEGRQNGLITNAYRAFFQDARSVLGHIQSGCELCASDDVHPHQQIRAGPVAIYACKKCYQKECVWFRLLKDPEGRGSRFHKNGQLRAKIELPRREGAPYSYACGLLSKRRMHQQRMKARRSSDAGTTRLIRRNHWVDFPPCLEHAWSIYEAPFTVEWDSMPFEMWHSLPAGIPNQLTFANALGLQTSEQTRSDAVQEAKRLSRARQVTINRRAAFNRIRRQYDELILSVESVTTGMNFGGWIQIIDLTLAARAFDVRWLFRQPGLRFGDWRTARYKILQIDEKERRDALKRLEYTIDVLKSVLKMERVPEHLYKYDNGTRACVLEIIKQLPLAALDGEWRHLRGVVDAMRRTPMTLQLHETNPRSDTQWLSASMTVEGNYFQRRHIVLEARVTGYERNRLLKAIDWPHQADRLTNEIVVSAMHIANMVTLGTAAQRERRDKVRAVVFGLPGAWPTWM